jgi:hypothetical protein
LIVRSSLHLLFVGLQARIEDELTLTEQSHPPLVFQDVQVRTLNRQCMHEQYVRINRVQMLNGD